jgi:hypothetical protein
MAAQPYSAASGSTCPVEHPVRRAASTQARLCSDKTYDGVRPQQ